MKESHLAKQCKLQNKVYFCYGEEKKHHQNLCPKKFGITNKPGIDRNGNEKNHSLHKNQTRLQLKKEIVIQTAFATVGYPQTLHSKETRTLIDTGSQGTYTSKQLTDNLQLRFHETQEYSIYMFGKKKPKKIQTSLVE